MTRSLSLPIAEIDLSKNAIFARLEEHECRLFVVLHEDGGAPLALWRLIPEGIRETVAAERVFRHRRTWRFNSLSYATSLLKRLSDAGHQVVVR